jgi:phosphate transport system substrate-binding protein
MSSISGTTTRASESGSGEPEIKRKGGRRTGLIIVVAVVVIIAVVLAGAYAAGWLKPASSSSTASSCQAPAYIPATSRGSSTPVQSETSQSTGVVPAGGQTLSGAGSTLVAPLMYAWTVNPGYYSNNTVNYASVGSGAGITDITQKTVDFGASDAPLNPSQRAAIPSPGVVTIPESAGGAVPIYNLPSVSTTLKFTGQVLAAIYLGDITNWNNTALQALNPGVTLPNACIYVVHRSDGSGTTFVWTSFLSSHNATWKSKIGFATSVTWPTGYGAKGNPGVTQTVKSTQDAIGYVDINYALTNGVAFGAVQNPAGNYIVANVSNIASAIKDANPTLPNGTGDWYNVSVINAPGAGDYPIATLTYLFVYKDLGVAYTSSYSLTKAEALVDFLKWCVTTGQNYAAEYYYVPIAPAVASADLTTINSITYNGSPIP